MVLPVARGFAGRVELQVRHRQHASVGHVGEHGVLPGLAVRRAQIDRASETVGNAQQSERPRGTVHDIVKRRNGLVGKTNDARVTDDTVDGIPGEGQSVMGPHLLLCGKA
jgi:hypothetical protein